MDPEKYMEEYSQFMQSFQNQEVSGESVGEMIAKFAYYFSVANMKLVTTLRDYNSVLSDTYNQVDPNTGKQISGVKAEATAQASTEYYKYQEAKAHVTNIEQCINALKALQKGIMNEFQYQGN